MVSNNSYTKGNQLWACHLGNIIYSLAYGQYYNMNCKVLPTIDTGGNIKLTCCIQSVYANASTAAASGSKW